MEYAKAIVAAVLTALWFAVGEGLLPDVWLPWLRILFLVAITYGVWRIPNRPPLTTGGEHARD